ncbi:UbiA family prenyltransferase [Vicingus serpentipes]|nr:UbiA family prenyltransferase [Vicingus serpentipes]
MRALIFLIRSVIYSNIFVSLCVTLLTHQSYILLELPQKNKYFLLIFVFCATYFTYNIQRILRINYSELLGKQIGIRLSWIVRNRKILLLTSILASITCIIMLFFLSFQLLKFIAPLAFLSIFYVVPFFNLNGKKIALRNYPYIKIIIIAIVWSFVTTALPFLNHSNDMFDYNQNFILLITEQFLFILAITLPFDIRDLRYDLAANVKTIPAKIGVKKTIVLSELLLVVFMILKYYQLNLNHISYEQFTATSIALFITGILIAFSSPKRPELFFSGLIEGTMVLMYLAVLIFEY